MDAVELEIDNKCFREVRGRSSGRRGQFRSHSQVDLAGLDLGGRKGRRGEEGGV